MSELGDASGKSGTRPPPPPPPLHLSSPHPHPPPPKKPEPRARASRYWNSLWMESSRLTMVLMDGRFLGLPCQQSRISSIIPRPT